MKVIDIMTTNPICCTPATPLIEAARLMKIHNFGAIPVVEDMTFKKPVGMITDRDIVCRAFEEGKNPAVLTVKDCMTDDCVTVTPLESIHECCLIMEKNRVRRAPVVDENGYCCGIVTQADIARHAHNKDIAELVREVSHL